MPTRATGCRAEVHLGPESTPCESSRICPRKGRPMDAAGMSITDSPKFHFSAAISLLGCVSISPSVQTHLLSPTSNCSARCKGQAKHLVQFKPWLVNLPANQVIPTIVQPVLIRSSHLPWHRINNMAILAQESNQKEVQVFGALHSGGGGRRNGRQHAVTQGRGFLNHFQAASASDQKRSIGS